MIRRVLVLLSLSFLAPLASARTLSWPQMTVDAKLDEDGRLHVAETQTMLFNGDWNGGERTFSVRSGQSLSFQRLVRIADGQEIPLRQGSLDAVDEYKWFEGNVLRWRSRLPSDPEFENATITYRLDYVLGGVLRKQGSTYRLNHDFAFPEREGSIEHFQLHLQLDPAWGGGAIDLSRDNLVPGESAILTRDLTFHGAKAPQSALTSVPRPIALSLAALLLAALVTLVWRFLSEERAIGRFAPLQDPSTIDEAWLQKNIFSLAPEVAGAAWDEKSGAPEVAAILARMALEKKISSEVVKPTGFFSRKPVLHMKLLVRRDTLEGYEAALVNKLFFNKRTETDTEAIRDHYKGVGLDLAAVIQDGVDLQLSHVPDWKTKQSRVNWKTTSLFAVAALLFLIAIGILGKGDSGLFAGGLAMIGLFSVGVGSAAAGFNQNAISDFVPRFILIGVLLTPITAMTFSYLLWTDRFIVGVPILLAIVAWAIAVVNVVLSVLRSTNAPEKITYRKMMASAREYFIQQLRSEKPHLRDEWLPYLLAFGLGTNVDSWFKSIGGAAAAGSGHTSSSFGSSSSSSGGGGWSWSGGGGAFGGAGATGAWTVAAGGLASGLAAPSSSGSGGGGGGGSSSGGGGGGGW